MPNQTDPESLVEQTVPEPLVDQTVLVTGGAGFIGSHLADALADATDLRVLDDLSTGDPDHVPQTAEFIEADVRDRDALAAAMADVDVVFHLAAVVSVARSVEDPIATHGVNVDGALAVLEAARARDARVVGASSAAIYGEPERLPIDESHPLAPTSPYGLEKLAVDHYLRLYAELYDLPTVALRPFNVYGPRQRSSDYSGVISIFRDQALAGDPITVDGDGSQTRDFVHVADAVRALLAAAVTDATGEAYNVGTGDQTSIAALAEMVRDYADSYVGNDVPIEHGPPRTGDIDASVADVGKARVVLGYEPRVPLAEGLDTLF